MAGTAPPIVVGRVRKPHGLRGELAIFPLTDDPEEVFTDGRVLRLIDLGGNEIGSVTIESARGYHRELLLRLRDHGSRESVEGYRQLFVAVGRDELPPLEDGEVYLQELVGFAVRDEGDQPLGIVSDVYDLPAGPVIEVQGEKREFLLPFRGEYVKATDRDGRRLTVTIPEGLLD
ncbi:MAG TPA: ribosome maturation factor RimM [Gemmatimonadales bacterium]|nr:ribosome maturation factor RimM [Gemmatimonadales bacterium]